MEVSERTKAGVVDAKDRLKLSQFSIIDMTINSWLSRNIVNPIWDIKNNSLRLKRVKELRKLQWKGLEEIEAIQERKLIEIIKYAYKNVPFYRKIYSEQGFNIDHLNSKLDIENLPVVTKNDLRNNLDLFISEETNKNILIHSATGGSTGTALDLYFNKMCQHMRNAADIFSNEWVGAELGDFKLSLWGNPPENKTLKDKIKGKILNPIVYLDTMDLSPDSINNVVKVWDKKTIQVIHGHAHSIFLFAKYLKDQSILDFRPKAIISTSMMLLDNEREIIEGVFACKVTDKYGCEEVGLIACECERHNGLHANIADLYIEFLDNNNSRVNKGEEGKIVITDLNNFAMPLIRYKIEDMGREMDRKCECGRGLPLLYKPSGRVADFLKKADGSMVAGISLIERTLTAIEGIDQMQIIQNDINNIDINIVPGAGYSLESRKKLCEEFNSVFGRKMVLKIHEVENISQDLNGKYRFSICDI